MTAIMVVVAVVIVAAVVAAVAYLAWNRARTQRLKRRFGPEYDRAVESHGGRAAAERELISREQRHQELELRDLDPGQREQYREQWVRVQERFVDAPESAVEEADRLVTVVMGERGYPTHGFEEKVAHLSVEHGRTLNHYRDAHDISARAKSKQASTEELRQAMVHYRALFEDLLHVPEHDRSTTESAKGGAAAPAGRHAADSSAPDQAAGTPAGRTEQTPRS
ncbi:hypothetical protein [Actinomadura fibrosa]|uniref:Secreted protein n=1 Tax=Actinomadura fibrosa TaxID=111802 RepID=A0ABW2XSD2_9ACTN|nr:hypothetical protein [Actinomadura fibrosa]